LKPATCINAPCGGTGELKVIVTVLAVMLVEKSVLGTPSCVTYNSELVESRLNSPLVDVVNETVELSPINVSRTL
jgi:hypothetical protein